MSDFLRHRGLSVLSLAVLIGVWELACQAGWINPVLLSPPSIIIENGWVGLASGRWNEDFATTFTAFGLGFGVATVVGTLAGVAMGASRALFNLFNPYVVAMNALPKIVLCPLIMIWFGTGLGARVFLGAMMASFPIISSTVTGLQSIDRDYIMLARAYRAGRWRIFRDILMPSITPYVLSGMRVGVNYTMVGVLIVEFFASSSGVGYRLYAYSQNFQIELFFVLLVLVVVFVLACSNLIHYLEMHFGDWRNSAFKWE